MLRLPQVLRLSSRMESAKGFLNYVNASPSPYHAVDESRKILVAAGYQEWSEVWKKELQ